LLVVVVRVKKSEGVDDDDDKNIDDKNERP
jgi:hypothetical protein